jgi:hypothetical protein
MGSQLSADRQEQINTRFSAVDNYEATIFNWINFITFTYVGFQLRKNPQRHLIILCFCFGMAALINTIEYTLVLTGNLPQELYVIAWTGNYIFFCAGHWKFVFQFFVGAIDTRSILWSGVEWHTQ